MKLMMEPSSTPVQQPTSNANDELQPNIEENIPSSLLTLFIILTSIKQIGQIPVIRCPNPFTTLLMASAIFLSYKKENVHMKYAPLEAKNIKRYNNSEYDLLIHYWTKEFIHL